MQVSQLLQRAETALRWHIIEKHGLVQPTLAPLWSLGMLQHTTSIANCAVANSPGASALLPARSSCTVQACIYDGLLHT